MDDVKRTAYGPGGHGEADDTSHESPGGHFGYEMAGDPRFAGRRWVDVEAELQVVYPTWLKAHGYAGGGGEAWNAVKRAVREAWESALEVQQLERKPPTGEWDQLAPEYRRLWEEQRLTDRTWEDVEPGYRYAVDMGLDPRYQGRPWGDVAPFLEAGLPAWAASHGYQLREGESLWGRLRDAVRHAWERARHHSSR